MDMNFVLHGPETEIVCCTLRHTATETVSSNEYFDLCKRSRDLRVVIG